MAKPGEKIKVPILIRRKVLDQRKYMNKFDQIQALLGLTEKEKSQILSINMLEPLLRTSKT